MAASRLEGRDIGNAAPLDTELEEALATAAYYQGQFSDVVALGLRVSEESFEDALSQVALLKKHKLVREI